MARPEIKGLKYYPRDVGFYRNKKIKLLRGEHGAEGVEVYDRIVSQCYENNGYYLNWDDDEDYALLADESGYSEEKIRLIVSTCLKRSLFDDTLFKVGNVLTSRGIQRRYFSAIKDTKIRAAAQGRHTSIYKDLCLLTEEDFSELNKSRVWLKVGKNFFNSGINLGKSASNPDKSAINPANERKGNERKENNKPKHPPAASAEDVFEGHSFSEPVQSAITDWLNYKKERRQPYKPTGQKSLLTQIHNKLNELTEQQVIYAITESMACNYQGIIWDKAQKISTNQNFTYGGEYNGDKDGDSL